MLPLLLSVTVAACTPASGNASAILQRASHVVGLDALHGKVLHIAGSDVVSQDYQSDRWYPPFLSNVAPLQYWYAPETGVERSSSGLSLASYHGPGPTIVNSENAAYIMRDTALVANEGLHATSYASRPLNVWAVIHDWIADVNARVVERCSYRDYPRLVLARNGSRGVERLFIDEKSGFPVKLERAEPHYLWGSQAIEYVYSTWTRLGGAAIPGVSFRIADGGTNVERNITMMELLPPDSAPRMTLPAMPKPMGFAEAPFLRPTKPDTIRVGPNAFLLKNPGYAEMVILARDTVFVVDATQGDERARQDSMWIATLFPGAHATALVVTDLAWPHVAGVPFWVSRGVPVYAPRASRAFLTSVIARRAPRARLRFIPVGDSLRLAGGDILLFPIDGVASEVAIAAFDVPDRTLWASDYIQDATTPTMYLDEVCRAVARVHRTPERAAAEHLPLTSWAALRPLAKCDEGRQ